MSSAFAVRLTCAVFMLFFSTFVNASAFGLIQQSTSGLGNYYAGSAATAEDVSTIYFNPAGLTFMAPNAKQLVISVVAIQLSARFHNSGSSMPQFISANANDTGGDAGGHAYIPQLYFAAPITERFQLGIGMSAPFGLRTEYSPNWLGRFRAVKSEVRTLNLNPSLAYRVTEDVSIGLGINHQKIDAELSNAASVSGPLCANLALAALCEAGLLNNLEAIGQVRGNDTAWGYNLGVIFHPVPSTRIGIAYRSTIKYRVAGDVKFARPTVAPLGPITSEMSVGLNAAIASGLPNGPIYADIELPDSLNFSIYQQISDQWEIMGDIGWMGWGKIQKLEFIRSDTGAALQSTPENWRDSFRVGVGANYRLNDKWKLRGGLAFDQSPIKDEFRTPRLPDKNRIWLSVGVQYKVGGNGVVDIGYAHLFAENPSINDGGDSAVSQATSGLVNGSYKNETRILGMQYTHSF